MPYCVFSEADFFRLSGEVFFYFTALLLGFGALWLMNGCGKVRKVEQVKRERITMGTRLYIGNVSYGTTEADLRELFAQAGEVAECNLMIDRFTNRSRGFAFVEMADDAGAQKAIEAYNGYELDDRALMVNEARPRVERN